MSERVPLRIPIVIPYQRLVKHLKYRAFGSDARLLGTFYGPHPSFSSEADSEAI